VSLPSCAVIGVDARPRVAVINPAAAQAWLDKQPTAVEAAPQEMNVYAEAAPSRDCGTDAPVVETSEAGTQTTMMGEHVVQMTTIAQNAKELVNSAQAWRAKYEQEMRNAAMYKSRAESLEAKLEAEKKKIRPPAVATIDPRHPSSLPRTGWVQGLSSTLAGIKVYAHNFYDMFDVSRQMEASALSGLVAGRFRHMAALVHPDKNMHRERDARELFMALRLGADILTTTAKRNRYNRLISDLSVAPHGGLNTDIGAMNEFIDGQEGFYRPDSKYIVSSSMLGPRPI
jgi:hypothetical protein